MTKLVLPLTPCFMITNDRDTYGGVKYHLGRNVADHPFSRSSVACYNGLLFTDQYNLRKAYDRGSILWKVRLPTECPEFELVIGTMGDHRANILDIVSKHSLYELSTYNLFGLDPFDNLALIVEKLSLADIITLLITLNKRSAHLYLDHQMKQTYIRLFRALSKFDYSKSFDILTYLDGMITLNDFGIKIAAIFNLQHILINMGDINPRIILDETIELIVEYERVNILRWLDESQHMKAFILASNMCNIGIMNWIQDTIMYLKFPNDVYLFEPHTDGKQISVLEWYKKRGIMISITNFVVHHLLTNGYFDALDWFVTNGYIISEQQILSHEIASYAMTYGRVDILDWLWKYSGGYISHEDHNITSASSNGHDNILQWFHNKGILTKYSEDAMDHCRFIRVLDWWVESGLPLKYSNKALFFSSTSHNIKVINWWNESGLIK